MTDAKVPEKIWLTRSLSLPVQECLSHSWKDWTALLRECWTHSTSLARWACHTLRRLDVVRTPGMERLPPLEAVDLYALAFGRAKPGKPRKEGRGPLPVVAPQYDGHLFWAGGKIGAATILRKVDRKYRKERSAVVWYVDRRVPEYRYPVPFPVHTQSWAPYFDERNRPCVSLGLPGGRVQLRLRGGPEFFPMVKLLRRIADGELAQQELSLCREVSYQNNRSRVRGGFGQQSQGGISYRVMCRIAYRLEVREAVGNDPCELKTGRDPFLTLTSPGREQLVWHAPQAYHWIISHRKFLDDFQDDLKFEKRWPASARRRLNKSREARCEKQHRRMKTFLQQTAHQVVAAARRRGHDAILYDDTDQSFAPDFPWSVFRENNLREKCREMGVALHHAASGAVVETAGGAESDVTAE